MENNDLKNANINKYLNSEERRKFARQPGKIAKTFLFKKICHKLINNNDKLLDIGGGGGVWADIIREKKITGDIYALDISEAVLNERNEKDKKFVGAMESLPFADHTFDKALFFASLHHVKNTSQALLEAKRILRPGGMIILWEPISIRLLFSQEGIKETPDKVEFSFSYFYLLKNIKKIGGEIDYKYFEGFLRRMVFWNAGINFLNFIYKIEYLINQITRLRNIVGLFSKSVIIKIKIF